MGSNNSFLERELARQLAPAAAPGHLWAGIVERRSSRRQAHGVGLMLWPVIALVFLVACADLLFQLGRGAALRQRVRQIAQNVGGRTLVAAADFGGNGNPEIWVKCSGNNKMPRHAAVALAGGHWIATWNSEPAQRPMAQSVLRNAVWNATDCASCHVDGHPLDGGRRL